MRAAILALLVANARFAAPCAGGLTGSRLARRVVARYGRHRVFRAVGTL
jgi:hypothetical protein